MSRSVTRRRGMMKTGLLLAVLVAAITGMPLLCWSADSPLGGLEAALQSLTYPTEKEPRTSDAVGQYSAAEQNFSSLREEELAEDIAVCEANVARYKELVQKHSGNAERLREILAGDKLDVQAALVFLRDKERNVPEETLARDMDTVMASRSRLVDELKARLEFEEMAVADFRDKLEEKEAKLVMLKEEQLRRSMEAQILGESASDGFGSAGSHVNPHAQAIANREREALAKAHRLAEQFVHSRRAAMIKHIVLPVPERIGSQQDPGHPLQRLLDESKQGAEHAD